MRRPVHAAYQTVQRLGRADIHPDGRVIRDLGRESYYMDRITLAEGEAHDLVPTFPGVLKKAYGTKPFSGSTVEIRPY